MNKDAVTLGESTKCNRFFVPIKKFLYKLRKELYNPS